MEKTYIVMFNSKQDTVIAFDITDKDYVINMVEANVLGVVRAYDKLEAIVLVNKMHNHNIGL